MTSERPFPPSARRLGLARAAGLTPQSPLLVGAAACIGAVTAVAIVGHVMFVRLGASLRSALSAADGSTASFGASIGANGASGASGGASLAIESTQFGANGVGLATASTDIGASGVTGATVTVNARDLVVAIASLALPILGAIAIAALVVHLAQTRAVWLPRRKLPTAPAEDPQRGTRGALAIANGLVIGAVAVTWLFAMAPRIAALTISPASGALLVASFLVALAITWVALGAVDALVRYAGHVQSLRMTPAEQREDQRLSGADPRWRARREKLARGEPVRDAIAGASVLVLGDGLAVAVAWDPVRRPVPTRMATGRAARATQLLGLARRHSIAVHRDTELATLLATGEGPIPERHWPHLADVIAATRRR